MYSKTVIWLWYSVLCMAQIPSYIGKKIAIGYGISGSPCLRNSSSGNDVIFLREKFNA